MRFLENGRDGEIRIFDTSFQVPALQPETIFDFPSVSRFVPSRGLSPEAAGPRSRRTGVTVPACFSCLGRANPKLEGVPPSCALSRIVAAYGAAALDTMGQCLQTAYWPAGGGQERGARTLTLYTMGQCLQTRLHELILAFGCDGTGRELTQRQQCAVSNRASYSKSCHVRTAVPSRPEVVENGGAQSCGLLASRCWPLILDQGSVMATENSSEVQHLLTLNEAARRLNVSRRTLERLISQWKFPHPVKINHSSRVLLSDLEGYVAKLVAQRPSQ
ncbi:transcriptional regulator, AlpA family [Opitutus sp. GAS368]|nr:transcriptional regulator, AlpA family [Opitutus sp. GAS368]